MNIEKKLRNAHFPDNRSILIENKEVNCTTCGKSLIEKRNHKDIHVHPVLDVLWCKNCKEFYGDGKFPIDRDGSDKFCRWCGQGGSLYCCSYCTAAFCKKCIRRNLDRKVLRDIEYDDWACFICDNEPLWRLRAICDATKRYVDSGFKSQKRKCVTKAGYAAVVKIMRIKSMKEKHTTDALGSTSLEMCTSSKRYVTDSKKNVGKKKAANEGIKTKPLSNKTKEGNCLAPVMNAVSNELLLKKLSDIEARINAMEKSFKDMVKILQSEVKKNEDRIKLMPIKATQSMINKTKEENQEDFVDDFLEKSMKFRNDSFTTDKSLIDWMDTDEENELRYQNNSAEETDPLR